MLKLIDLAGLRAFGITWTAQYLRQLEREGRFPRRVHLGERRVAWVEQEVQEHVAKLMAARRPGAADHQSVARAS